MVETVNQERFARILASGFGSGFSPIAPGTAGSVVALVIGAGLLHVSAWLLLLASVLAVLGSIWALRHVDARADPAWVVIDEFAGQWIALLGLPILTWTGALAAFALFRLLDIAKPGPVGWADRQKNAWGLMGDDMIAGAIVAAVLAALGWGLPGLLW